MRRHVDYAPRFRDAERPVPLATLLSAVEPRTLLDALDSGWAYATLGASSIVTEEFSPILGGFAAHEGHLGFTRIVLACAIGAWVATALLYAIGRWHAEWAYARWFPEGGRLNRVLGAVRRRPWYSSFLVRFAFGARIILPVACGVAHVPVPVFLIGSAVASLLWSVLFVVIGWAFGESAMLAFGHLKRFQDALTMLLVIAVVTFFIVAWVLRRRRRNRSAVEVS